jgi:hypothetical protein
MECEGAEELFIGQVHAPRAEVSSLSRAAATPFVPAKAQARALPDVGAQIAFGSKCHTRVRVPPLLQGRPRALATEPSFPKARAFWAGRSCWPAELSGDALTFPESRSSWVPASTTGQDRARRWAAPAPRSSSSVEGTRRVRPRCDSRAVRSESLFWSAVRTSPPPCPSTSSTPFRGYPTSRSVREHRSST